MAATMESKVALPTNLGVEISYKTLAEMAARAFDNKGEGCKYDNNHIENSTRKCGLMCLCAYCRCSLDVQTGSGDSTNLELPVKVSLDPNDAKSHTPITVIEQFQECVAKVQHMSTPQCPYYPTAVHHTQTSSSHPCSTPSAPIFHSAGHHTQTTSFRLFHARVCRPSLCGGMTGMRVKREGKWIEWTYDQYFDDTCRVAKSLIKVPNGRYPFINPASCPSFHLFSCRGGPRSPAGPASPGALGTSRRHASPGGLDALVAMATLEVLVALVAMVALVVLVAFVAMVALVVLIALVAMVALVV
eukprot:1323975-Amorphochlora_amoeboformis.AAC.2